MKYTAIVLGLLLIATNAFWLFSYVDQGVTLHYHDDQLNQERSARRQLAKLALATSHSVDKEQIVAAAKMDTDSEPFEKNGCTWVDFIGLKFDENEQLQHISPAWSFGEVDPCWPDF